MNQDDAQIQFLEALGEASRRKVILWRNVDDDNRDAFEADVDGQKIEVDLLYLPSGSGKGSERALVRVNGLKTWFTYAVGTRGYDLVMSMLASQFSTWASGTAGALKHLEHATKKIQALLR